MFYTFQPVTKKGGAVKSGASKKVDGVSQKASKSIETPEDVEVI